MASKEAWPRAFDLEVGTRNQPRAWRWRVWLSEDAVSDLADLLDEGLGRIRLPLVLDSSDDLGDLFFDASCWDVVELRPAPASTQGTVGYAVMT